MHRSAALFVPAATVVLAAVALAVAAAPREHFAARVFGGPTEALAPWSLRVVCVHYAVGVEDLVARDSLVVSVDDLASRVSCGPDGVAELSFSVALTHPPHVVVRSSDGALLADGIANVSSKAWRSGARVRPARIAQNNIAGSLTGWQVFVDGGGLPVGARGRVTLRPSPVDANATLQASATGANVEPPIREVNGDWSIAVTPTFVAASLDLVVGAHDRPADASVGDPAPAAREVDVRLPVVAGALVVSALRREGGRVRARVGSVEGRARAYIRLEDDQGRRAAMILPLASDVAGATSGEIDMADGAMPAWLVVAGDAEAAEANAFGWPVPQPAYEQAAYEQAAYEQEARDGRVTRDQLWVDGLSPQLDADRSRERRARWVVGGLVLLGALLEIVLLAMQARASTAHLRAHLHAAQEDDAGVMAIAGGRTRARLVTFVALIIFGFAVVGILLLAGLR